MYVNPESADNAIAILTAALESIEKSRLSDGMAKVRDSIADALNELKPFEYKPYADISTAAGNYVALRDMLSLERHAWEDHEADVKSEMIRISMWLRDRGDELGVDSFNTPFGTAYRNVKTSYRVEDWKAYAQWIIESGNLQCLEKRPAQLAVKEIIDETGDVPPGLYSHVEVEFNVRRPTKAKAKAR